MNTRNTPPGKLPPVLDVCCGSRMFWYDKTDARAVFVDKRRETVLAADMSVTNGERSIVVDPDVLADFTCLPFEDGVFSLVVFDPPHVKSLSETSWLLKKYGALWGDWQEMIRGGFSECFRVLRPGGTLIFKWSEVQIPLSDVLALTDERPLFGHKTVKRAGTHWVAFIKPEARP